MEVQVVVERVRVQRRIDVAALEQRRQTGGEAQALAGLRQVQRLDAEPVAGDEQAPPVAFPDGEGEHSIESGQQLRAPGVVSLQQHFRIAVGKEAVTQSFQLLAQFRVVVDGAVENH
ncbi:hypothetical protein D9M68_633530 [compost metagenome]